MAVGDIYEVAFVGLLHGQNTVNVWHYRSIVEAAGNGASLLAASVDVAFAPLFIGNLSQEWSYVATFVAKIFPLPRGDRQPANLSAGPGTVAQNSLPSEVAATITKRTGIGGKKFRGRIYVGGIPEGYETDSILSPAGQANIQLIGNGLSLSIVNAGWQWEPVLFHRADGTANLVTSAVARAILRAQRRRQFGRGGPIIV